MPRISNLKKLAESVSRAFDIPLKDIAGEDAGKVKLIGGKNRRVTFIPIEDEK